MKHSRFANAILTALLVLFISAMPLHAQEKAFHILTLNDPHSNILPMKGADRAGAELKDVKITKEGGMTRAIYLINREKKIIAKDSDAPIFLFEGGDIVLGLKGGLQGGHAEYEGLAVNGFDAGVLGNHEFDCGIDLLADIGRNLKFPVLASNIKFTSPDVENFYSKSIIIERDGVKIGLFGLVTPELKSLENSSVEFEVDTDIEKCAAKYVAELRAKSVDCVVALTHIGLELDKKLAASVPGIDIIIGGHSHDALKNAVIVKNSRSRTIIGQAGLDGRFAGRLDAVVDNGRLVPEKCSWKLLTVKNETRSEPKSQRLGIEGMRRNAEAIGSAKTSLCNLKLSVDVAKESTRSRENAMGSFLCDAMCSTAGTKIGMINGGALRSTKIIAPGNFCVSDLFDLMPFDSKISKVSVTGLEIRKQLEMSASSLVGPNDNFDWNTRMYNGEFLQVTGIRFDIDLLGKPALVDGRKFKEMGNRVKNITVNTEDGWQPLDDSKIYEVAALDYTVKFWDKKSETILPQPAQTHFAQYMASFKKPISLTTDGRINIINGEKNAEE
ncbi:MAG: bifunctional UDP-sugar hydrolase/5'-nucleotidase [Synergistes sp.]|nr:bifunctional UDP-sugar hydrolase/5'-nucleotidase [Synergistes sp.]